MIGARNRWMTSPDGALAGDIRLRPARRPLFGRRRRPKTLTSTGWFSLLCVVAVGAALAHAL